MRRSMGRDREENLDHSVARLLSAAFQPPLVQPVFRDSVRREIECELARMSGEGLQDASVGEFEPNIGSLLVAATAESAPGFVARQAIRDVLVRRVRSRERREWLPRWMPRLVAASVPAIAVVGFLLYPLAWSYVAPRADVSVMESQAEVTRGRPLFFNLGTRVTSSLLTEGERLTLHEGDAVTTGADSAAVLSLFDRGTVTLYPGTTLVISDLEASSQGGQPFARVALDAGLVRSEFHDVAFVIDSPVATTSIVGTVFKVEVIDEAHTDVSTDEGIVRVNMGAESIEVSAGEEACAKRGQPLVARPQRPPLLVIESPETPETNNPTVTLAGRTDVDAVVTVDGVAVPVDVGGAFRTQLSLVDGANRVVVVSTSPLGRSITVELMLFLEQR